MTEYTDDLDDFFIACLWNTGKGVGMADDELIEVLRKTYGDRAVVAAERAREIFSEEK